MFLICRIYEYVCFVFWVFMIYTAKLAIIRRLTKASVTYYALLCSTTYILVDDKKRILSVILLIFKLVNPCKSP